MLLFVLKGKFCCKTKVLCSNLQGMALELACLTLGWITFVVCKIKQYYLDRDKTVTALGNKIMYVRS